MARFTIGLLGRQGRAERPKIRRIQTESLYFGSFSFGATLTTQKMNDLKDLKIPSVNKDLELLAQARILKGKMGNLQIK